MRQVVISGGPGIHYDSLKTEIRPDDFLICVDSGADYARKMNLVPDKLLGDLDSIAPDTLDWIEDHQVPIEAFPVEKDMTDSELCLRELSPDHPILWFCSLTGRPDHVLSNLLLSAKLAQEGYDITLTDGLSRIYPRLGPCIFRLDSLGWSTAESREELAISILPIFDDLIDVTTIGLYYPLSQARLIPGSSFSVSNKVQKNACEIGFDFTGGVALITVTPAV